MTAIQQLDSRITTDSVRLSACCDSEDRLLRI